MALQNSYPSVQSHHQAAHHSSLFPPTSMNVAFPSLVTPIITSVDHHHHSTIMNSSSVNSQQGQSSSSSQQSVVSELTKIQAQNQTLTKKLQLKNVEYDKLVRKVERLEAELSQFKDLLSQINMNLEHGQALNSDAVKFAIQTAVNSIKSTTKPAASKPRKQYQSKRSSCSRCVGCDAADRPYQCDYPECGKRFLQKAHLDTHRGIHNGARTRYVCEWQGCGKSFVSKYSLTEHTKLHQDAGHNRCMYPGCGSVFSSKYGLSRHQAAQHQI